MAQWRLIATCQEEEVYCIEAESPEAARLIFEGGDAAEPVKSEVLFVDSIFIMEWRE